MKNFTDLIRAFSAAQSNLESAIESVDTIIDKMFNGYTASEVTHEGLLDKFDTMIENLTSIAGHITTGGSAATWSSLTGKPFSTIGDGLTVTDNVLASDFKKDLLWTNSDTTTAFVAQTININLLKDYDEVEIYYKSFKQENYIMKESLIIGNGTQLITIGGGAGSELIRRRVTSALNSSTLSLTFTTSLIVSIISAEEIVYSSSDNHIIPYKIYGIKY